MNAPILLFAYNRPELTLQALTSLAGNKEATESDLYIYADGPKANAGTDVIENIKQTRQVIRAQKWCRNVTIIEADKNKGLANSIITGVTESVNKFGKAIIMEDDVIVSKHFLSFMNDALNLYQDDEKVFGIGGWNYFCRPGKVNDPFFLRYPDSITWAIYKRSWNLFIHDAGEAQRMLNERNLMKRFNPFNNFHYFDHMLEQQQQQKVDSWAIRWTATAVLHDGLFLYPQISISKHMGGTSGTHEKNQDYNDNLLLAPNKITLERQAIVENQTAFDEWKRFVKIYFLNDNPLKRVQLLLSRYLPSPVKLAMRKIIDKGKKSMKRGIIASELLDVNPVSRKFGFDRGTPIDRYYIDRFLESNREYIKGAVLEIADAHYSRKFNNGITSFEILHFVKNDKATIVADLSNPMSLPADAMDCFICTQTLNFIYDVKSALNGCYKLLKPGGVLLVTVAGICQISQYDNKQWGDYWRFTPRSLERMAGEVFGTDAVKVSHYGNSLAATLLLKGYAVEDTNTALLDQFDEDYAVLITLVAVKKKE